MNRTLLLILCDFLLLTLLALTRWETAEPERPEAPAAAVADEAGAATGAQDIVELMKLSFEDQQAEQAALAARLDATAAELAQREDAVAQLEGERSALASNLDATRQAAEALRSQVESVSGEAAASRARVEQLQRDLEQREAEAARQAQELEKLAREQTEAVARIQSLDVAVRVAEQEKVLLRETADTYRQQAEVERQERLKVQETTVQLAEGVGQLAEKSAEITQEMRENRPINANTLFSDFLINRVPAEFTAVRSGLLGEQTRTSSARTILVTDGATTHAVLHLDDTPFNLHEAPAAWSRLTVTLARGGHRAEAAELRFLQRDPRIVSLPVGPFDVGALGVKVYRTATDPFRFPEAVLISNGGAGYGEVPFKLEAALPGYVRMDTRLIRRLVGDFTPTRGDLVLSKTGELLGVMVDGELCALVDTFVAAANFRTGDLSDQDTAGILTALQNRVGRRTPTGPRGR